VDVDVVVVGDGDDLASVAVNDHVNVHDEIWITLLEEVPGWPGTRLLPACAARRCGFDSLPFRSLRSQRAGASRPGTTFGRAERLEASRRFPPLPLAALAEGELLPV